VIALMLSCAEPRCLVPTTHPRILFLAGDRQVLLDRRDEPVYREFFAALKQQVEKDLEAPLPPIVLCEDLLVPGGEVWEVRYLMEGEAGLQRARAMSQPYGTICAQVQRQSLAHWLWADSRYLERGVQCLETLAALPLPATGYANTHTFHGATGALAAGLDYLWGALPPARREALVEALVARALEFHALSVRQALRDPLDSHAIMYGPPGMLQAALALYHHRPEAREWLEDVLRYFTEAFPGYGGDDGGWGQGFGYGDGVHQQTLHTLYVGTGINLFAAPWGRNNGRFMMYFQPPYGSCPNFGDAGYNRPKSLQKQVMGAYARIHQDPYYQWHAEQIQLPPSPPGAYQLSLHLKWPPPPPARPPRDLPQALHMRDIGWVALHSDLAEGAGNVMVQFKSSPFGSFSHSHADQNSFVLEAFGRPLLIDSGYYPWYGSPHDMSWTRQTRAHNALLVNRRGQGVWNRAACGRITAFASSPYFDYVAGDATPAYQHPSLTTDTTSYHLRRDIHAPIELCAYYEGVERMRRHLVFVRPHALVILDEVQTRFPASVQFLLHALQPFALDPGCRRAQVVNGEALARVHLLGADPLVLSQTDRFTSPPELGLAQSSPKQWHLEADFAATSGRRWLLSVIQIGRAGQEERLPAVRLLGEPGEAGVQIGEAEVRFRLGQEACKVSCLGPGPGGVRTWFEFTQ
jgi:hypothetical protein